MNGATDNQQSRYAVFLNSGAPYGAPANPYAQPRQWQGVAPATNPYATATPPPAFDAPFQPPAGRSQTPPPSYEGATGVSAAETRFVQEHTATHETPPSPRARRATHGCQTLGKVVMFAGGSLALMSLWAGFKPTKDGVEAFIGVLLMFVFVPIAACIGLCGRSCYNRGRANVAEADNVVLRAQLHAAGIKSD